MMGRAFAVAIGGTLAAGVLCAGDGADNLLKNADFEAGMDGWRRSGKVWRVETGAGYAGTRGLVWENADPTVRVYPAQYPPIEPAAAYRFRALVKVDELKGPKGAVPRVGFEWCNTNGVWGGSATARPVDDNGLLKDGWVQYEGRTPVMGADVAKGGLLFLLPKGCTGKVRFDNASFVRIPVQPVEFAVTSADRDTADGGTVRVLVSLHANASKNVAELAYADEQGVRRTAKPVLFAHDRAVFELDVARLARGRQDLAFTLRDTAGGAVLGTANLAFTRAVPRRRVTFDAQRRMHVDGKPFFPLGLYVGRMADGDYAEYKRGPYNFAVQYGGTSAADLDKWRQAGVFVATDVRRLVYGYSHFSTRSAIRTLEESKEAFRRKLAEVGDHPALLMWYLNDEAPVDLVQNTTDVHRFLHELDPERATLTCLCQPKTAYDFLPSFDVMAHDCYPIGNHVGKNMMERVTRQMREIDGSMLAMRPLWFIPQAFDWKWCYSAASLKTCDQAYLRMPTREEMACMTWQGVACGANGVILYAFHEIRHHAKGAAYEKAWGDTCAVAEEVKKMEPVLLADGLAVSSAGLPEFVVARAWRHDGGDWYLVVNATREAQAAKLVLDGRYATLSTALGRGAGLSADGRSLDCTFGPMEYAFVRLGR